MKKTFLVLAMACGMTYAFAQDLTSKKGEPILPEADDWSLGIDAYPFLNFAGNLFNGNVANNPPFWSFLNSGNRTIVGKLFKDEKTAYRAIIRIGINSYKETGLTPKPVAAPPTYPATIEMVEDEMKISGNSFGLGGGLEMRRGKTRLQGLYGADMLIFTTASKTTYTYSNALAPLGVPAVDPADSYDFGSNVTGVTDPYGNPARVLEDKGGRTTGINIRGFIGAEYFIFPKISIGGEFGWGFAISSTGAGSQTVESHNGTNIATFTTETGKSSSFNIDTDQNATGTGTAALRLNLHF